MKLFTFATISAVALSAAEAGRNPNKIMADSNNSLDCQMNPDAPEDFIKCFYNKHASGIVNQKTQQYKRVASRIASALENAGDNKALQKKYTKSILIKNANLFGQEKKEMKELFDNNVGMMEEYIDLVKTNVSVEEARDFLNNLKYQTVSEVQNNLFAFVNQKIDEYASKLPEGLNSIDTNAAVNEFQNAIKSLPQVKAFLNQNSDASLQDIFEGAIGQVKDEAEKLNLQGKFDEIKNKLNN